MDKKPITVSIAGGRGGTKTAESCGEELCNKIGREALPFKKETKKSVRQDQQVQGFQ